MEKHATAICSSQSDRFMRRFCRTMTGRCSSWMRTWQRGNMPILLKTQVESTAKTPIPACRARGSGLCGFRGTAERVPAESPKTGRCTAVRDRCGHGKRRKRTAAGEFQKREKPQAASSRTKPRGRARPAAVTSARGAGSFGDLRGRSKHSEKQPEGVAE